MDEEQLADHLAELMQAACGDDDAGAELADLPAGAEGTVRIDSSFGRDHPIAQIRRGLSLANAEATTLHEVGHWTLGHLEGLPKDETYQGAVIADSMNGTVTRGPWEQEADRKGLALLEDPAVRRLIVSNPADVEGELVRDARKFGPFPRA